MKIRRLKELMELKEDYYTLHYIPLTDFRNRYQQTGKKGYIAAGSLMYSDLLTICLDTMVIAYALDTYNKGRSSIDDKGHLLEYWDAFQRLIDSGQIDEVTSGNDKLENPITVYDYDYKSRTVKESFAEELGWPNITHEGVLMYDNLYFVSKQEAIADAVFSLTLGLRSGSKQIYEAELKIKKQKAKKDADMKALLQFQQESGANFSISHGCCSKCSTPFVVTDIDKEKNWICDACLEPINPQYEGEA